MATLTEDSLAELSRLTGLDGTGQNYSTPLFYKALMQVTPPVVRSMTNVRYEGIERIPKIGPVILAGNHTSHIDPIVKIMGARRPVHYLAKAEHFEDKTFQKLMTSTGQIETVRETGGAEALAMAVDVLEGGGVMGIFPEGTRSRRTEAPFLQRGKTGVAESPLDFRKFPWYQWQFLGLGTSLLRVRQRSILSRV